MLLFLKTVVQWGWPDNYSQVHWSAFLPHSSYAASLVSSTCFLFFINIKLHSHLSHLPTSFHPAPEAWRTVVWSPFWGAFLGGSPWIPRGSSPLFSDAWPLWTWWPSVWAALWGQGSTSCLERWPETVQDPASSSPSSSLPWRPYSLDCAMQSLGPGFPRQAQHTFTAMWL